MTLLAVALIFSPFAIVARADSWWAKRFYDEEKLIQTAHRYPGHSNISDALTL